MHLCLGFRVPGVNESVNS
uniref:Uncharacterized protein n=1 Tax=Anguilla anguilla TaxID=7936 RepID=A0A0E9R7L9_ANGAN